MWHRMLDVDENGVAVAGDEVVPSRYCTEYLQNSKTIKHSNVLKICIN